MAKTSAERIFGPLRRTRRAAALPLDCRAFARCARQAQSLADLTFDGAGAALGDVVWLAVTAGTALAALAAFALFLRARARRQADDRRRARRSALRAALDRTEALLDADDQRTIVWDSAVAPPQVFGGLPERVGAPADKARSSPSRTWLSPESADELEAAADKLRRQGEAFQIAVRTPCRRAPGSDRPHQRPRATCCACAS